MAGLRPGYRCLYPPLLWPVCLHNLKIYQKCGRSLSAALVKSLDRCYHSESGTKWGEVGHNPLIRQLFLATVGQTLERLFCSSRRLGTLLYRWMRWHMFLGRYEHSLDSKGRLTLPSEYAADLAAGVVLTRGMENCVYLFPNAEFDRISVQLNTLSLTDSRARKLKRWLLSNAQRIEPDRQRRVIVPQRLRDIATISDKVLIAGMDTYLELWQPEAWDDHDRLLEQEAADQDFFASLVI